MSTNSDAIELHGNAEDTQLDCRGAIERFYAAVGGRIDIRTLWSEGTTQFFRVNWWRLDPTLTGQYIGRSAFVSVEVGSGEPVVRELTSRQAA